jgi:protein-L-isoaspartate O-methyltransferase
LNQELTLRAGLEAGGAPVIWERALREAWPVIQTVAPPGSRILEVGYGDGRLTCYLARELGWRVVGLEVSRRAQEQARQAAREFGVAHLVEFLWGEPAATFKHRGQYDVMFIKTVLYNAPDLAEYGRWLDWIVSVLRPGGILVNFETGRGNALTRAYRRLRRRDYVGCCLYTRRVEALYEARFDIIHRRYYGGVSQFLAPLPPLYSLAARLEEGLRPRQADNSFIVAIIARLPLCGGKLPAAAGAPPGPEGLRK